MAAPLILDATPPRTADVHLTSWAELERHRADTAKAAGYERLVGDLGVDPERFAELAQEPRLVLAEQTGCWFYGEDVTRHRLLEALIAAGGFHAESGVMALAADAFTFRGVKRLFVTFKLHRELGPVPLVGASYLRRHRNLTYRALDISGTARERIAEVFDLSIAMLEAARCSPTAFADAVATAFRRGVRSGLRPLLPRTTGRKSLEGLSARLAAHDLDQALGPLRMARHRLADGASWRGYWNGVNQAFLGSEIGRLGPLFNRFLLAIDDPVRMARTLIRECRIPPGEPVAVAGIALAEGKYRMVFFDPGAGTFFYRPRAGEKRRIDWCRVREMAAGDETGGPASVPEYLMMAAAGLYLVADGRDGHSRFERAAREIHRRYTGLAFPTVALPRGLAPRAHPYLDVYTGRFEEALAAALETFFNGGRR